MPELNQDKIRVFSKVSGKTGTLPIDKFEPRLYIPLDAETNLPDPVKMKIDAFIRQVSMPQPTGEIDLLGGPVPQIAGTVVGGLAGGILGGPPGAIAGAAAGGVIGRAVTGVTEEIRGEEPPKTPLEMIGTLSGAALESAAADVLGGFAVKMGAKLFTKAGKFLGRGVEIAEGLPKGSVGTLIEEPAKVIKIAKGEIPFSKVVGQTKEAVLAYGKKVGQTFDDGLKEIKNLYPDLQFAGKEALSTIDDSLKTMGFKNAKGQVDFTKLALTSDEQKALVNAYNKIKSAKGGLDELRVLKQELNNFYKPGKDHKFYNKVLADMKNKIDSLEQFPDELKQLNQFYSDKIDNFNKMSAVFDPKDISNAVNRAESSLSQLVGKQPGAMNERAATKALLEELKKATGVDILDEIKVFEAGRAFGKPFPVSIPTVIGLGQAAARKATLPVIGTAAQIKAVLPESIMNTFRASVRGLSDAATLQFIKELTEE